MRDLSIRVVFLVSWLTSVQLHHESIAIQVCYNGLVDVRVIIIFQDNPTSKFGEALRGQVEERLLFFEKGAAPSKNTDVIRKVLQDLALEEQDDEMGEPALTTLEATPAKKKKEKKEKRKADSMDVDGDEDSESEHTQKKVKLSKDEKKALKKAKKQKAKSEAVANGVSLIFRFIFL